MKKEQEKGCVTCAHAASRLLENPCHRCLLLTRWQGKVYPEWEPREDDE